MCLVDSDKVIRLYFCPFHYNVKTKSVKYAAFRPPAGRNDLSVNILKLTNLDFCWNKGKSMQTEDKTLIGLGVIEYLQIKEFKYFVGIIKDEDNIEEPSHANIICNYTPVKDKPLPNEVVQGLNNFIKEIGFIEKPHLDK